MKKKKRQKIIVALSGGIDSAYCAFLLSQKDEYIVEGIFMRNWDSFLNNDFLGNENISQNICPQEQDYEDAKKVAKMLNIKLHRIDFIKEYWDFVFQNFISEYSKGRTPNPDILCNKYIKFDYLLKYALDQLGADFLATGHYAKIINNELYRAFDKTKDQSYFLAQLNKEQLAKVMFPLENLTKNEIRKKALEINLPVATKKDSTGICFIGERKFDQFLQNYIPAKPGDIIDIETNKIVGKHNGVMYYTFGQKKGLNLGGMNQSYVLVKKNLAKRILYVAPQSKEDQYLSSNSLIGIHLNLNTSCFDTKNLSAKFRYRQEDVKIKADFDLEKKIVKVWYDPFLAITPGQQIVFYDGEKCIGGAEIDKLFLNDKEVKLII